MKFAEIIREAGLSVKDFPKMSEVYTILYDRKDRIEITEKISYIESLFKHSRKSYNEFKDLLIRLENCPSTIEVMNVRIDQFNVILFYKSDNEKIFSRKKQKKSRR